MSSPKTLIDSVRVSELRIPFRSAFTHASASRSVTSTIWVEALQNQRVVGQGEACPRPYVTGETIESSQAFVAAHAHTLCRDAVDLPSLGAWMDVHREDIDANPAAWCALELAWLDACGRQNGLTLEALLGLQPLAGTFRFSAVVGDDEASAFARMVGRYRASGFLDFKVKLAGDLERDRRKLDAFRGWPGVQPRVRADANNAWRSLEDAVQALQGLDFTWFAIEEPLGAGNYSGLLQLAEALDRPVVLDESLVWRRQIEDLPGAPSRWIINVRVSKMGGVLRSLDVVAAARAHGVGVIVGAQVGETSLLTRAGLAVASAAGDALVAQEGAFGTHLLVEDVCARPLMFGAGGVLDCGDFPTLTGPGLGIDARPSASMLR